MLFHCIAHPQDTSLVHLHTPTNDQRTILLCQSFKRSHQVQLQAVKYWGFNEHSKYMCNATSSTWWPNPRASALYRPEVSMEKILTAQIIKHYFIPSYLFSFVRLFICSFVHSFIHSFIHPSICPSVCLFVRSFSLSTSSSICLSVCLSTCPLIYPPINLYIRLSQCPSIHQSITQ